MGTLENKLLSLSYFSNYPSEKIQLLGQGAEFVTIEKDRRLFSAMDDANFAYVVYYGAIKLLKPGPTDRELVMCFLGAGDFCGAGVMNNHPPKYPVTAIAQEDSGLIRIARKDFSQNWLANPEIARVVQQNMLNRLMEFQQDKALAPSSVQIKIANFLLRTLENQDKKFGNRIAIRLTRQDIADRVGTTIETVIRVLSDWTRRGWLNTSDQHIEILSKENLQRLIQD